MIRGCLIKRKGWILGLLLMISIMCMIRVCLLFKLYFLRFISLRRILILMCTEELMNSLRRLGIRIGLNSIRVLRVF